MEELTLEEYKRFFDDIPVALVRTDLKTGKFLLANKYAVTLLGFETFEELQSQCKSTDLYPENHRRKLIQKLKKFGVVENYELNLTIGDRQISVSARFRLNCDGKCIEGSLIDITELVNLREKQLGTLQEVGKQIDLKIATMV